MADSKLADIIRSSLEKIKEFSDTETIIGSPITLPGGQTVIPVSKVSMGFASGGMDLGSKKKNNDPDIPTAAKFGGVGGTGVTVTPVAFLVAHDDGRLEILPVTSPTDGDTIDKVSALIERSPDILARIKNVFVRKKEEPTEKSGDPASDTEA